MQGAGHGLPAQVGFTEATIDDLAGIEIGFGDIAGGEFPSCVGGDGEIATVCELDFELGERQRVAVAEVRIEEPLALPIPAFRQ